MTTYALWLLDLHEQWAWFVVLANGIAGLWALGAHAWVALRRRALWWFTAAAEVAVFAQVIMGVGLVAGEGLEAPEFHMFYGFIGIMAVGILFSYRSQLKDRIYLLYGLGSLFVMGLAIRAMVVGQW